MTITITDHAGNIERLFIKLAQSLLSQSKGTLMPEFTADVNELTADVAAQTALVGKVSDKLASDKTALDAANAEIATLKAQGVDTTALEAAIAQIKANNDGLAADVQAAAPQAAPAPADPAPAPADPAPAPADPATPATP